MTTQRTSTSPRFYAIPILVSGMLLGAPAISSANYIEDFTSYGSDTVLNNGDLLASGALDWNASSIQTEAGEVIAADDNLVFSLNGSTGNNKYAFLQETTDVTTPSSGQEAIRSVNLSLQQDAFDSAGAQVFGVGFYGDGLLPAGSGWGSVVGMTVQFADFSGTNAFVIRRRGTDGSIDSWDGTQWTNNFTEQLSGFSLNSDYTVRASIDDASNYTLEVLNSSSTVVESATSSISDIFNYTNGMRWTVGDYNDQNADLKYQYTVNSLELSTIPEPSQAGLVLVGFALYLAVGRRASNRQR